jgi:hypothetical protein
LDDSDNENNGNERSSKHRDRKISNGEINGLKLDSENVTLHPIYILSNAFTKVNAVGSSTAMVAIRN